MSDGLALYFAHPINTYDTFIEKRVLAFLRLTWPSLPIVNPGEQKHIDMVELLKSKDPKTNVMGYFLDLVRQSSTLVLLPFGDGKIGAGVWSEAEEALKNNITVWTINPGSLFLGHISSLDPALRLTVDETRARVYYPDRSIRPYE